MKANVSIVWQYIRIATAAVYPPSFRSNSIIVGCILWPWLGDVGFVKLCRILICKITIRLRCWDVELVWCWVAELSSSLVLGAGGTMQSVCSDPHQTIRNIYILAWIHEKVFMNEFMYEMPFLRLKNTQRTLIYIYLFMGWMIPYLLIRFFCKFWSHTAKSISTK